MTREEAHNRIDSLIAQHEIDDVYVTITNFRDYDALRMARKLLEQEPCEVSQGLVKDSQGFSQEPCEDAISRQAVKETIFEQGSAEKLEIDFAKLLLLQRAIKALPSVTPQPKMGHWIRVTDKTGHLVWECDKCGWQQRFNTNFCPDCGCAMVEPQESEDKE